MRFAKGNPREKYSSLSQFFTETWSRGSEHRPFGFVYIFYSEKTGLTKIGKTRNLRIRCKAHAAGRSEELIFLFALDLHHSCSDCDWIERYIHKFFNEKRAFGEWFNLSPADIFEMVRLSTIVKAKLIREMPQSKVTTKYVRSFDRDIR